MVFRWFKFSLDQFHFYFIFYFFVSKTNEVFTVSHFGSFNVTDKVADPKKRRELFLSFFTFNKSASNTFFLFLFLAGKIYIGRLQD